MEQYLTVAECAKIRRCSEKTIRCRIADGNLKANKVRGHFRIRRDWFNEFMQPNIISADDAKATVDAVLGGE